MARILGFYPLTATARPIVFSALLAAHVLRLRTPKAVTAAIPCVIESQGDPMSRPFP